MIILSVHLVVMGYLHSAVIRNVFITLITQFFLVIHFAVQFRYRRNDQDLGNTLPPVLYYVIAVKLNSVS